MPNSWNGLVSHSLPSSLFSPQEDAGDAASHGCCLPLRGGGLTRHRLPLVSGDIEVPARSRNSAAVPAITASSDHLVPPAPSASAPLLQDRLHSTASAVNLVTDRKSQCQTCHSTILDFMPSHQATQPTLYTADIVLTCHHCKMGLISVEAETRFLHVGIVPDDIADWWIFLGISHFPCPCILVLLHIHLMSSSSGEKLVQAIVKKFPYLKVAAHEQECFLYNVLLIVDRHPALAKELMVLVVSRYLLPSILGGRTSRGFVRLQLNFSDQFTSYGGGSVGTLIEPADKLVALDVNVPCSSQAEGEVFEMDDAGLLHTMDVLMGTLFHYVHDKCTVDWEHTKNVYSLLLHAFERVVLPTHATGYMQFVIFYLCSFRITLAEAFINFLWRTASAVSDPPVIRQAAIMYLASFLARAHYVTLKSIRLILEVRLALDLHPQLSDTSEKTRLSNHRTTCVAGCGIVYGSEYRSTSPAKAYTNYCTAAANNRHGWRAVQPMLKSTLGEVAAWIHKYIRNQDEVENVCVDIRLHGVFYSICQAVFYVVAFRHTDLVDSRKNLTFLQSLGLAQMVTCVLNPLRVCCPVVVRRFAAVTRTYQLAYCYTVMERNARSTMPVIYTDDMGLAVPETTTYLETVFPFDPLHLPQ
ncbi:hypothetical protein PR048_003783 [Dryococelus australis]|uniref:Uncharacterized protein n=1 Tax=Dryococelus australis TaxID=614101 RepID=A0ABQ9IP27_9NEOP|nr:hypothetical protein PR048_003783 [Dryococelus australis]